MRLNAAKSRWFSKNIFRETTVILWSQGPSLRKTVYLFVKSLLRSPYFEKNCLSFCQIFFKISLLLVYSNLIWQIPVRRDWNLVHFEVILRRGSIRNTLYTCISGPHHTKRSLISWAVVNCHCHLVWHRLFQKWKKNKIKL